MILEENYTLSNGVEIPKLALGTWFIDDDAAVDAVKNAIALGYRHIDTAQAYQNERGVGEGLRASGAKREDVFITTKLDAGAKTYEAAVAGIEQSLTALGVDYIDLMIIHSPHPWTEFRGEKTYFEENRAVWRAFEEAYEAGTLRAIGLSNFEEADIENILGAATVEPMVNQILVHISNTPKELIAYTQSKGILIQAYSPVAHGELLKNETVRQMAEKYGVTVPQLSWSTSRSSRTGTTRRRRPCGPSTSPTSSTKGAERPTSRCAP